ncbi:Spo0B C-terminal domain-containing protein [Anaerobacillus isosaccharinicus]|uniref:Spo0B domain-containing protein n=1 Tax=Anaerobacillus isosaccharinicus TaxID=1532552 RepID=A0A1S2KVA7_9BACI|nr:Spo0B C-terminal domain-containing protein [Anaerobacillus isosaccharinicus]MBA5585337.1 Spo0B domain-containing protein [Anaerobacillus isosaccharinicus]QOY36337.1 Spo0B domain-containing protein [Anaerobacillus isosaccharinicus]
MKDEWNILQILRHSRHDWLNVMQLIKGNLALKKYDRVEEIIQEVVNQSQHESKLSNLSIPNFANEILVFNWEKGNHFQLEFEVIGECQNLNLFENRLQKWFHQFSFALNESCEQYGDNHLQLTIELLEDEFPRFTFDFQGKLTNDEKIKKIVENENNWNEQMQLVESYISKEEFYVTFKLIN